MFSNKKFITFIEKAKKAKKNIVCVNVLDIHGSTYRKSGATMFINSDGESIGLISDARFEEYILFLSKEILLNKKGRYIFHNFTNTNRSVHTWEQDSLSNTFVKLWIEPFYYDDNYGSIGIALENILSGISNTLIRSLKYTGVHSFSPNFDEEDNYFNKNKNIFYQKVKGPLKLLIFGTSYACEPLIKMADTLGWQITVCDTRGTNFKRVKYADDIILLDSSKKSYKVMDKHFDAAVVITSDIIDDKEYLKTLLESDVSYIGVIGHTKKIKNIVDSFHMKKNIVIDDRLHYLSNLLVGSSESIALSICSKIESQKNDKVKYEFT